MRIQDREKIEEFLEAASIRGRHITVAFSGGADSLALLVLLSSISSDIDAVYVNHNLRSAEELSAELKLNRANAAALSVPFKAVTLERGSVEEYAYAHGTTLEAAARSLRYEALEREASDLIATAHTSDDQAETLMMRLISGCTLSALAGVRRQRGRIVRPVLGFSRADTERICREAGLVWAEDSTNSTLFCQRNRIRQLVSVSAEEKALLLSIAGNVSAFTERLAPVVLTYHKTYHSFDCSALLAAHPLSASALVFEVYSLFTDKLVSQGEVEEFLSAVKSGSALDNRFFHLRFCKGEARVYPLFPWFVTPFSASAVLPHGLAVSPSEEKLALRLEPSLLSCPAVLRLASAEDEIRLKDHTVKVGELLSQYHVPYAIVLEDMNGIAAFFSAAFRGRDRLAGRFICQDVPKVGVSIS